MVAQPEAAAAPQHDAGGDVVLALEVENGVAEEAPIGALPIAEVCGQFQAVVVHRCAPKARPVAAGAGKDGAEPRARRALLAVV